MNAILKFATSSGGLLLISVWAIHFAAQKLGVK